MRPLLASTHNELNGDLSPDGRWLAYQSDESGRYEIYVSPFPDTSSQRRPVSSGGGREPRWSRDGSELFYRGGESGAMIVVPVDLEPDFEGREIPLGTRAYVRVNHGNEALASQWYRRLRQVFLRQFNV